MKRRSAEIGTRLNYAIRTLSNLSRAGHMNPPQQPQLDPRLVQFAQRNHQFLERYGQRAYQALDAAHNYMMRPRNPNTNNPAYTGMGWSPQAVFTPAYFDRLKT